MEQPEGTFVACEPDETVGVDYVEDCLEQADAAVMVALNRRAATRSVGAVFGRSDAHDQQFVTRRKGNRLKTATFGVSGGKPDGLA
jgi:hypothetical protein